MFAAPRIAGRDPTPTFKSAMSPPISTPFRRGSSIRVHTWQQWSYLNGLISSFFPTMGSISPWRNFPAFSALRPDAAFRGDPLFGPALRTHRLERHMSTPPLLLAVRMLPRHQLTFEVRVPCYADKSSVRTNRRFWGFLENADQARQISEQVINGSMFTNKGPA